MKLRYFHYLLMILFCFSACEKKPEDIEVLGLEPVYFDPIDFSNIETLENQLTGKLGKILKVSNFIFINEIDKGIHVIDNTSPDAPIFKYFWSIPGNRDFTIKNNWLYAENGPHLLKIDISNFQDIKFDTYNENIFSANLDEQFPEDHFGYFKCADPNQGRVKEWKQTLLTNPKCFRQ